MTSHTTTHAPHRRVHSHQRRTPFSHRQLPIPSHRHMSLVEGFHRAGSDSPIRTSHPWHAADLARRTAKAAHPLRSRRPAQPGHLTPTPRHIHIHVPCLLDRCLAVQQYPSLSAASLELCISLYRFAQASPSRNKGPRQPAVGLLIQIARLK
jgi:hypothetical protein